MPSAGVVIISGVFLPASDLLTQLADEHVRLALRALGLRVEQLASAFVISFVRGVAGVGERDAQHRRSGATMLVGRVRLLRLPAYVGDQRLVIVEIELRPLGLLGHLEQLQSALRARRRRAADQARAMALVNSPIGPSWQPCELLVGDVA